MKSHKHRRIEDSRAIIVYVLVHEYTFMSSISSLFSLSNQKLAACKKKAAVYVTIYERKLPTVNHFSKCSRSSDCKRTLLETLR